MCNISEGNDEAVSLRLEWHTIAMSSKSFPSLLICLLSLLQLLKRKFSIVLTGCSAGLYAKGSVEKVSGGDQEGEGFKEVSEANLRDKGVALEAVEAERGRTIAEQWVAGFEGKLREAEMNLTIAESVVLAQDKEVADLRKVVAKSEDKFYNMGFTKVENSCKPIMVKSQWYEFGEG